MLPVVSDFKFDFKEVKLLASLRILKLLEKETNFKIDFQLRHRSIGSCTVFIRINTAARTKIFTIQMRRLFKGGAYLRAGFI